MVCHRLTLTEGQGHRIHLKFGKMAFFEFFDNISYAIYIRVMKLDQKVAYEETFKMMYHRLTLTKGQGHRVHLKFGKMAFFEFFDNISYATYIRVMKLGPKVAYE